MPIDLNDLNPAQRKAVECTEGALLVLAGAGSGKTRVLTYRIAHLVEDLGVAPWQILAITFTNKAAAEMRERLGRLMGAGATKGMWVSTFHAMCVRMLRRDADRIGFTRDFTIYDDDDSKRLVKEVCEALGIDLKRYPINALRSRISMAKNQLVLPDRYADQALDDLDRAAARVYRMLQQRLKAANAMDFDDLLVNTYLLLKGSPDVLERYQGRFAYIHVDEYQDTNHAQYAITNLLAAKRGNLMVVGDDDQSIYSWRGADISNILEFEKDYPQATTVKLEQNYRSTGHILAAANAVVANNPHRKAKHLFTDLGPGEKVGVYLASDGRDEGRWIAGEIERLHRAGTRYSDVAVFYRTNAQSRLLEDMLLRAGVPYVIVGGTRFFDRAEIRDVMAYLKVIVNPADDISAKRIINTPRRGIGSSTIERLEHDQELAGGSFMQAVEHAVSEGVSLRSALEEGEPYSTRVRANLQGFLQVLEDSRHMSGDLRDLVEMVVTRTGLIAALESEKSDEARSRIENIREFFGVAEEYDLSHATGAQESDFEAGEQAAAAAGMITAAGLSEPAGSSGQPAGTVVGGVELARAQLGPFMEWLALRTDLDTLSGSDDAITMMTIHSAKGLEFPVVFVAGMEDGIFPHFASMQDPQRLEEERRLAYVAITRARRKLNLTCAATRQLYGTTQNNPISRFVTEIPSEHVVSSGAGSRGISGTGWERRGDRHGTLGSGSDLYGRRGFGRGGKKAAVEASGFSAAKSYAKDPAKQAESFAPGDQVDHKVFGRGVVVASKGDSVTIRFAKSGQTKKLLKGYAPIVKIS